MSHAFDATSTTAQRASGTTTPPRRGRPAHPANHEPRRDPGGGEPRECHGVELRARQVGEHPGDELEPGSRPAREPGETGGRTGRHRIDDRRKESEPEDERSGQERDDVRRHRVQRRLTEVEDHDRRRGDTARERDRDRIRNRRRNRVAVESVSDARHHDEDGGDGRERELESGLEERRRHPGHEHERSERQEVPAVGRSGGEPCERREPSGDTGPHDRGLPPDCEDVGPDGHEDRELPHRPREPQQPAERVDPSCEEGDVLPGDGQEVVQPRGAEIVLHVGRQALVLPEHDSEHDAATGAARSARHSAFDPVPEDVAEAGDSTASPDLTPARRIEDDVDSLTREPRSLVEAAFLRTRRRDPDGCLEDGSPRRRPPDRQDEQDALAHRLVPERARHGDDARRPGRRSGRRDGDELRDARRPDVVGEDACAKSIHPERTPREPEHRQGRSKSGHPHASARQQHPGARSHREQEDSREGDRHPDRQREPDARGTDQQRGPVKRHGAPHGVTRSRSCSIRVGPMPGTASRSSTEANGPCSAR